MGTLVHLRVHAPAWAGTHARTRAQVVWASADAIVDVVPVDLVANLLLVSTVRYSACASLFTRPCVNTYSARHGSPCSSRSCRGAGSRLPVLLPLPVTESLLGL